MNSIRHSKNPHVDWGEMAQYSRFFNAVLHTTMI